MIQIAQGIKTGSWLLGSERKDEFQWFVDGYGYASTQTWAIPTLHKVSAEELYFAVRAVLRGARLMGHDIGEIGRKQ